MRNNTKYPNSIILILVFCFMQTFNSYAQKLDKFLDNFEKSVDAVGKTLDNIDKSLTKIDKSIPANKKGTTNKNNSTYANEISQNTKSTKQSKSIKGYSPPKFSDGDLYPLTENLFVNISSKYPSGYEPKWRLVGTTQQLQLNSEVYISKNSKTNTKSIPFGIVEYQGKTVVRMRALDACECVADIDLPNSKTTLTNSPTEFELVNFRKVQLKSLDDPNAACKNMSSYTWGGWKGNITLSSDSEGNIKFDIRLENYSNKGNLYWLLYGNDIEMPNMVTPNSAKQTVQKNEIAKIEEKKSEEKRIKEESIKKKKLIVFERELPRVKAKADLNKKIALTYKGYNVPEIIDFDKNFPYQRVYNSAEESSSIYHNEKQNEITKKYSEILKAHSLESRAINKRLYDLVAEALKNSKNKILKEEPHLKDKRFAKYYLTVKSFNQNFIYGIAAWLADDLDLEKKYLHQAFEIDDDNYFDYKEYLQMVEYLEKK